MFTELYPRKSSFSLLIFGVHESSQDRWTVNFNSGQQAKIHEFCHDDETTNVLEVFIGIKDVDGEDRDEEGILNDKPVELSQECPCIFSISLLNIFLFHYLGNISVVILVAMIEKPQVNGKFNQLKGNAA